MTNIDKAYTPETIEQRWYQHWEAQHFFQPSDQGHPYTIMLPPPNVTGSLHMGHGFGFTIIDILIRYHRMCGMNTLWQAGTDHAGIATQMVVERQLNMEQKTRHDLGREQFVEKIWEWKTESGGNITRQLRRLGASIDWTRERFTMDDAYSKAVTEVFIQLYEEGLIYRGKRLVNWDPVLLTAISDLEVINQEEDGSMWHIRYPLADGHGEVIVATTRPETMLGDVAVAVHPDDERYQALIGKQIHLPLTDRLIPIIADDYVDPAFGTGCVKITPAHDFNDYAVGSRHQLEPINIFTPTAHLNENAPQIYQGLDRFKARKQILIDLETANLLVKTEKHQLKIPRGDRSNAVIEPYLTYQWYVNSKVLAEPAIRAVETGEIRFIPENWSKTYFQWMYNIEDWCISRQLWWGHRIPIWYDREGKHYVGHNETDVRQRYQLAANVELKQDEDVLDTWFSSALWPFASLGWPEQTKDFKTFFPTNVLVTGFDIIFFWVARMIMMSLKFTGQVPFRDVYITGLIRDAEGHKMSKSKGNVIDPIDIIDGVELETLVNKRTNGLMQPAMAQKIEKSTRKEFPEGIPNYGTDALRFTFCSLASVTREIRFDTTRLNGNRHFCNKLWNAARYVLMNTEGHDLGLHHQSVEYSLPDVWIQSRLQAAIKQAHEHMHQYRFDLFAQTLYDFTWNEFCDWYLELSKPILTSEKSTSEQLRGTRQTLVKVLEQILLLLHPVMPFITEEIWQRIAPLLGKNGPSIMLEHYPEVNDMLHHTEAELEIDWLKNIIVAIRSLRSEMNIPPGKQLTPLIRKGNQHDHQYFKNHQALLFSLAKLDGYERLADDQQPPESASAFVGELEIYIPLAGLVNKADEEARLMRDMQKIEKDIQLLQGKLNNPNFVERAPKEVIEKDQKRLDELVSMLEKLKAQREKLMMI